MSILDTFYMLFEADASKLDQGLAESERKSNKLTEAVKKADESAVGLGGSLKNALGQLAGAAVAYVGFQALKNNILEAANAADRLGEISESFGIAVEDLSAYSGAVTMAGGNTESFVSSLTTLQSNLASVDATGKSKILPFLKELGLNLESAELKGKSALELMPYLAGAFEKLSKQEAVGFGKKLGLDEGTVRLLQEGRIALDERIRKQKELGVVTEEQAKVAAEFNDSLDYTRMAWRGVWLEVATAVLPIFKSFMEVFESLAVFIRKRSDFVIGALIGIGSTIAYFVVPSLLAMIPAAKAAFILALPFLAAGVAIAALIGLFALLYDDIVNFMEGNDSLIGQLSEKWPIFETMVRATAATMGFLLDTAKAVFSFLVGMFTDPGAAFEKFKRDMSAGIQKLIDTYPGLSAAIGMVSGAFEIAGETIGDVWDGIVSVVKTAIDALLSGIDAIASGWGKVKSLFSLGGVTVQGIVEGKQSGAKKSAEANSAGKQLDTKKTMEAMAEGKKAINQASIMPLANQTSNSISNSRNVSKSTSVQVGKVEVKTQATDAEGISKAIGGSIQAQMQQAATNYDDGVLL